MTLWFREHEVLGEHGLAGTDGGKHAAGFGGRAFGVAVWWTDGGFRLLFLHWGEVAFGFLVHYGLLLRVRGVDERLGICLSTGLLLVLLLLVLLVLVLLLLLLLLLVMLLLLLCRVLLLLVLMLLLLLMVLLLA